MIIFCSLVKTNLFYPLYYKNTNREIVTKKFDFFSDSRLIRPKRYILLFFLILLSLSACSQPSVDKASLDKKIGQMILVGFRGLEAPPQSPIAKTIKQYHIGGVVLFDYDVPLKSTRRNIESPEQLQKLTGELQTYTNIPLFITIDQEGGKVARLKQKFGFPSTVSAASLGTLGNTDTTRYYARKTARTLNRAGINVNLAPVVDLNINQENPVIGGLDRSFAADPRTVTTQADAYINGIHSQNILTTLKHFPGHGSSKDDSHKGIVDITKTWQKEELIPYKNLIDSGQADIIMTAHIYNAAFDSAYPATLSKPVITGMLRDSLGFKGVVMSDDLQMGAIRKYYELKETIELSIKAGVDILVFANNSVFNPDIAAQAHQIISGLVRDGEISEQRINKSYERIMKLKERIE